MKEDCTYQVFYLHHHHVCQCLKAVLLYGWNSQVLRQALQGPPRQLSLYIFGRTVLEWDNLPTWESKCAPWTCQLRGRLALIPDMLTSQIWCRGRAGGRQLGEDARASQSNHTAYVHRNEMWAHRSFGSDHTAQQCESSCVPSAH